MKAATAAKLVYQTAAAAKELALDATRSYQAEPGQYRVAIMTDKTGNQTEKLMFAYSLPVYNSDPGTGWFELFEIKPNQEGHTNCENVIYDSTYGGFKATSGALYTRIDSSYNFVLEQLGETDLPVDKAAEELFQ